jgi:hypothetical protein
MIQQKYKFFIIDVILLIIFIQKAHTSFEKEMQNLKIFEKKVNILQIKFNTTKNMNLIELMELELDEILSFKKHCMSVNQILSVKIKKTENIFSIFDLQNFCENNSFYTNFAYNQILDFILQLQKIGANWNANEILNFFCQRFEFKEIYIKYVIKIQKEQIVLKFQILTYQLLTKNNKLVNDDVKCKKMEKILEKEFFKLDHFLTHIVQLYKQFPLLYKQIFEMKDTKPFIIFHYLPLYFWHRAKTILFIHKFSTKNIYQIKI